jgi:hypothetical protein
MSMLSMNSMMEGHHAAHHDLGHGRRRPTPADREMASMAFFAGGRGMSFRMISVITPRVPSEPTKSCVRLCRHVLDAFASGVDDLPLARTISSPHT